MNKEELDQYADVILKHPNLLLQWATGCGKTKQAIRAIDRLDKDHHNRVLIVVAEIAHKKNWIREFQKWNPQLLIDINYEIEIICYNSLHHHMGQHYDLVIFDESHHLGTNIRLDVLTDIYSSRFLLLSATMDKNIIYAIEEIIGPIYVSTITLQQSIDWGLLPEPTIVLVPMELDNIICDQVVEETRGKSAYAQTIHCTVREKWNYLKDKRRYPNLKLLVSCTQRQKYNDLCLKIEYYKKLYFSKQTESIKNKWLQYGSQRKVFLGSLKDKKAREIITTFGKSRYICFCTNIEQADKLGGNNAIHSEKDKPLETIDKFNDKQINSLFVVGMLKEGQNLVDIEKGLIIQLDGKILPFIQKTGRVLRAEYPEIYIIYIKGTQDEIYLNRALEHVNPEYIRYYEDHN